MSDGMRDTYAGRRDHQPDAEAECTDLRARLAAAEADVIAAGAEIAQLKEELFFAPEKEQNRLALESIGAVRALGEWLAECLDGEDFANVEPLLLAIIAENTRLRRELEAVRAALAAPTTEATDGE